MITYYLALVVSKRRLMGSKGYLFSPLDGSIGLKALQRFKAFSPLLHNPTPHPLMSHCFTSLDWSATTTSNNAVITVAFVTLRIILIGYRG